MAASPRRKLQRRFEKIFQVSGLTSAEKAVEDVHAEGEEPADELEPVLYEDPLAEEAEPQPADEDETGWKK